MTEEKRKIGIATAAFGGFLIMMGIVMMSVFVLVFFDFFDIAIFMEPEFRMLFIIALLTIGICDLVSGVILTLK